MMQSKDNRLIIASAGSGKTTYLVNEALSHSDRKVAILTYTNNNINEIKKKFYEKNRGIPRGVDVKTWYTFLLHECARPYQRSVSSKRRVRAIYYPKGCSAKYVSRSDTQRYFFWDDDEIYADKISCFIIDCQNKSNGLVTKRLANIYDDIFIDEFQDLSGYDLDLVEVLLKAEIRITIVGDPRQSTYTTNNAPKNSQYRGMGILNLADKWVKGNLCQIDNLARSYRCNQIICDYADSQWPDMPKTVSENHKNTDHDGIFIVSGDNIHDYMKSFSPSPIVLRYNRKTHTYGYSAQNFGDVKGLEFDRVLIIPHGPMKKYLRSGDVNDIKKSIEKFYVAVTRARHSVALLYDGKCGSQYIKWTSNA